METPQDPKPTPIQTAPKRPPQPPQAKSTEPPSKLAPISSPNPTPEPAGAPNTEVVEVLEPEVDVEVEYADAPPVEDAPPNPDATDPLFLALVETLHTKWPKGAVVSTISAVCGCFGALPPGTWDIPLGGKMADLVLKMVNQEEFVLAVFPRLRLIYNTHMGNQMQMARCVTFFAFDLLLSSNEVMIAKDAKVD